MTGLRPRLFLALLLTSVVTLAVAALALLSPLEQRLREDGESTVTTALGAARPELTELPLDPATGRLSEGEVKKVALLLRRRSQATLTILDSDLDVVYAAATPTLDVPDYYGTARLALRSPGPVRAVQDEQLIVAQRIKIAGSRYVAVLTRRLDYVSPAVTTVRNAFLEAAGVGLLVALLLGLGLASTLLRRLERLRDAARELERRGPDADPLPADHSRDEIGELARAFAGMRKRLRTQEAARRAFVATASHELRTPLTSLDGMLELLEDDISSEQPDLRDARERVARARQQSRRLSRLASDLLDLSRLDADVQMRSEPLELGELCRAVAAEFELGAHERDIALHTPTPPQPCWAQGDPGAVARIVRILLDNALHTAPARSTIDLEPSAAAPWAQIDVRDRGPGVPPAERDLIFERFKRGSTTGGQGGFGLGLAIGRELAVRMGGSLELLDGDGSGARGEGGARFRLRLPAANGLDEERLPA
ncbi:MAG TPA: HAMP domain-containing sensor histidine kinase [Solirubrobacteraceae bacterium]|jgi:signal transduction histidine kinase|nr:HAMP domain-containing sensor histidine kinase [Solirubrobacteraceae bacterium]